MQIDRVIQESKPHHEPSCSERLGDLGVGAAVVMIIYSLFWPTAKFMTMSQVKLYNPTLKFSELMLDGLSFLLFLSLG